MTGKTSIGPRRSAWAGYVRRAVMALLLAGTVSGQAHALTINVDYGNLTPEQVTLVNAVLDKWFLKLYFPKEQKLDLEFQFVPIAEGELVAGAEIIMPADGAVALAVGPLGVTDNFQEKNTGVPAKPKPSGARIRINAKYNWWEGVAAPPDTNGDEIPDWPKAGQYDMYTVLKHEIGHAIGFTRNYTKFRNKIRPPTPQEIIDHPLWAGKEVYDDGITVISLSHLGGTHTDERKYGDVMNPELLPCTRVDSKLESGPILARFWDPLNPKKRVPSLSQWGLITLALLLMAAGSTLAVRRRTLA